MKIRSMSRSWFAALASASMVVIVAGCTSSKMLSAPQPAGADDKPKKEYLWKDMSTGKSFFQPIDPSTQP